MKNLSKASLVLLLILGFGLRANAQQLAIKTNLPYWLTASPNIGAEYSVGDRVSLELTAGFNPFNFGDEKLLKHWVVWPEVRYWFDNTYNGHFVGIHAVGGQFNLSGWDIPISVLDNLKTRRYKGSAIGAGFSYGYQWELSDKWGLEVTLGLGFVRFNYESFTLGDNPVRLIEDEKNYFGPTKGAFSLIYYLD